MVAVNSESEDGHFFLGKYYDRLMSVVASDRLAKSGYKYKNSPDVFELCFRVLLLVALPTVDMNAMHSLPHLV